MKKLLTFHVARAELKISPGPRPYIEAATTCSDYRGNFFEPLVFGASLTRIFFFLSHTSAPLRLYRGQNNILVRYTTNGRGDAEELYARNSSLANEEGRASKTK